MVGDGFSVEPMPYGPSTMTVGAGVLVPILFTSGAVVGFLLVVAVTVAVLCDDNSDGFLDDVLNVGRAGVGPLT